MDLDPTVAHPHEVPSVDTADAHEPHLLEVSGLAMRYATPRGPIHAVGDVSFFVSRGETVGLIGESGCGKSATMRSVLGLLPPNGEVLAGSVRYRGRELLGLRRSEMRHLYGAELGFVAQNPFGALNPILTVERQFRNLYKAHGHVMSRARARVATIRHLESVSIADAERVARGYAHQLSGGLAQRVVIAMALCLGPQLIIADEPTTALDVTIQKQILDLLRSLVAVEDRSMLLVTHDLGVVAQYCERVLVMYAGCIVESGRTFEVFTRPAHPYTAALLNAVPQRGKDIAAIPGRPPDLRGNLAGCSFAERCEFMFDRCVNDAPEVRIVREQGSFAAHSQDAHSVRCHLDFPKEPRSR